MIKKGEYTRIPERDWQGVKVKSLRELRNGMASLPAGTVFTITGKQAGFGLKSDPCGCCGVVVYINKVASTDLQRVFD